MLSIGLLGAGRIGTLHGRNIAAHPKARLAAIADAVAAPAEALGRELNVPGAIGRGDPGGPCDPGSRHLARRPIRTPS